MTDKLTDYIEQLKKRREGLEVYLKEGRGPDDEFLVEPMYWDEWQGSHQTLCTVIKELEFMINERKDTGNN